MVIKTVRHQHKEGRQMRGHREPRRQTVRGQHREPRKKPHIHGQVIFKGAKTI